MRRLLTTVLVAALALPAGASASHPKSTAKKKAVSSHAAGKSTTTSKKKKASGKGKKGAWKRRGQQAMNGDRIREIQEAMIRGGYLQGEASGVMDSRTKEGLLKIQSENGWQTKIVPDSRALIKLGLGPKHDGLLNPDSAAVNTAETIKSGGDPAAQPPR